MSYSDDVSALAGCACSGARNVAPLVDYAARGVRFAAARAGELPTIALPAAMQARAQQLLGDAARLDESIQRFAPPPAEAERFFAWAAAWRTFHAQLRQYIGSINWFDKLWAATAEQIETYAGQLGVWQQQFRELGGFLPGVVPPLPSVWRSIGIGVAAGLVTATIIYLVKSSSPRASVPLVVAATEPAP